MTFWKSFRVCTKQCVLNYFFVFSRTNIWNQTSLLCIFSSVKLFVATSFDALLASRHQLVLSTNKFSQNYLTSHVHHINTIIPQLSSILNKSTLNMQKRRILYEVKWNVCYIFLSCHNKFAIFFRRTYTFWLFLWTEISLKNWVKCTQNACTHACVSDLGDPKCIFKVLQLISMIGRVWLCGTAPKNVKAC